jgi:histidyl-tRNA synthetase
MALVIAEVLRHHGLSVDLGYSGNLARRMRRANRANARAAVLIGENEAARNVVTLRDLDSGDQTDVPMDNELQELRARLTEMMV